MSKHLSPRDITILSDHIASFKGTLTWEALETSIQKIGYTHSKWALRQHDDIKAAYDAKKIAERTIKKIKPALPMPKVKAKPTETIEDLKAQIHTLQEQLTIVLDNAAELGVPMERMQRPPHPVSYNPTPQRR